MKDSTLRSRLAALYFPPLLYRAAGTAALYAGAVSAAGAAASWAAAHFADGAHAPPFYIPAIWTVAGVLAVFALCVAASAAVPHLPIGRVLVPVAAFAALMACILAASAWVWVPAVPAVAVGAWRATRGLDAARLDTGMPR